MKGFFKLINFFLTTLSIDLGVATTGTLTITDKIVDGYTLVDGIYKFHIIVDLPNKGSREIFRIWKVVGTTLYYDKRISPVGVNNHLAGSVVQINDVSEMLNSLSKNVDMFGFTEIKTGLTVTVYGGDINKNGLSITAIDTDILLTDNTTSTIGLDFVDGIIKVVADINIFKGYILCDVVTLGGLVTTITEKRSVELGNILDTLNFSETAGVIKIIGKSITNAQLADLSVGTTKLIDLGVTTGKVADGAITNVKIAANAVANANLNSALQNSVSLANKILIAGAGTKVLHDDGNYKDVYGVISGTLAARITTQSATPALNTDGTRSFSITGLTQDITSMTSGLTGTPTEGDMIEINITDDGVARNIFWGTSYEEGITIPTVTIPNVRLDLAFVYNSITSKWRCVGSSYGAIPNPGTSGNVLKSDGTNWISGFNPMPIVKLIQSAAGITATTYTHGLGRIPTSISCMSSRGTYGVPTVIGLWDQSGQSFGNNSTAGIVQGGISKNYNYNSIGSISNITNNTFDITWSVEQYGQITLLLTFY